MLCPAVVLPSWLCHSLKFVPSLPEAHCLHRRAAVCPHGQESGSDLSQISLSSELRLGHAAWNRGCGSPFLSAPVGLQAPTVPLCVGWSTQPHSPVADRTGPSALARAPRLLRIPMTLPFWLAEPGQAESHQSAWSFDLPGARTV